MQMECMQEQFIQKMHKMFFKSVESSTIQEQYDVLASLVLDELSKRWLETNEVYRRQDVKEVYYISIEFLLGSFLGNNLLNLGWYDACAESLNALNIHLKDLEAFEMDAGLGNGGLGRLAACFMDSLASSKYAGHGCGIRYKHGLFEQKIVNGEQVEFPERWLKNGYVWEVKRKDLTQYVNFGGQLHTVMKNGKWTQELYDCEAVKSVPYDIPIVGYDGACTNTLRIFSAEPLEDAPVGKDMATYHRDTEAICDLLYPDDSHDEGKILRLKQQYFLVSSAVQNIVSNFKLKHTDIHKLPERVAIQINDTHPVLAIPEFMRILIDQEGLAWEEAFEMMRQTISYTNHTTLVEALERWPIYMMEKLLPRVYQLIDEIHHKMENELRERTGDEFDARLREMAILYDGEVRMANLAVYASGHVNGVAALHTEILKNREFQHYCEWFPDKFVNVTNGITPRRWLLKANPKLTKLISEMIGTDWIYNPMELERLLEYRKDTAFLEQIYEVKQTNKARLANLIYERTGEVVSGQSIFDIQVKRLHAYKRQLLNVLHIIYLYQRLKTDSMFSMAPRTFIFGAKASPRYIFAKKIIQLICEMSQIINNDPHVSQYMKVIFLENYNVSLAEQIMPACDVSEQISTASKEASGTGNMKFMMNGAITIGTLDGANVEMYEQVGDEGMFIFGLRSEEVIQLEKFGGYASNDYYAHDLRIKNVLDFLVASQFGGQMGTYSMIYDALLHQNDQYFVLKDFASYVETQEKVEAAYKNKWAWAEKSLLNTAKSGVFSSDRTIKVYADKIWGIKPVK